MRLLNTIITVLFFAASAIAADGGEEALVPRPVRVEVVPARDTLVRAGETIFFRAAAYDSLGNVIRGLSFTWSLVPSADTVGYMTGSTFTATKVGSGRVRATSQGVSGASGLITVRHGNLSRIFLDLSSEQLARMPLITSAEVIFYDAYDNLVADHDLTADPVTLAISPGQLQPHVIADNSQQIGGVLRLLDLGVRHLGSSSVADVSASSHGISSQIVETSFNGYDLVSVTNADGSPVEVVYEGSEQPIRVVVVSNGTMVPSEPVRVSAGFKSGGDVSTVSLTGGAGGRTDTVLVSLPTHDQSVAEDAVLVRLEADYVIAARSYTTVDTRDVPIKVVQLPKFTVSPGSVGPDAIYAGEPCVTSFEVFAPSFSGPVDSTTLVIELAETKGGAALTTVFSGRPEPESFEKEVIRYGGIQSLLSPAVQIKPGWYWFKFYYRLHSAGLAYALEDNYPDSIYVLPQMNFGYASGTLSPTLVYAGAEASFGFAISVEGDRPVNFYPEQSLLTVTGVGYRVSTSLASTSSSLHPGLNEVAGQEVFIPASQLGQALSVSLSLAYSVVSVVPTLVFASDFGGERVTVQERPVVQIVSVDAAAPNKPKVNAGQAFQIVCRVNNPVGRDTGPVTLGLTSDGQSQVPPGVTIPNIPAGQTVDALFDVVAAHEPSAAEVFSVEILSENIAHLPHIDNTALIEIERSAELVLAYDLLGLDRKIIPRGREFGLVVEIVNLGDADATEGKYVLTTGGVDFGGGDSLAGSFSADQHLGFTFKAPSFDTVATFRFFVVEVPLDKNSLQPAKMTQQSFEFDVRVETLDADLVIEPTPSSSRLILPGRRAELFSLGLTNLGLSANTRVRLREISVLFTDQEQQPISAGSLVVAGQTGFFEGGLMVTIAATGDNRAVLTFEDLVIEPSETRILQFEAVVKQAGVKSFNVGLDRTQIEVVFVQGPNQGTAPTILSSVEDRYLVNATFALKRQDLQASLVIQDNPFNPELSPAVLSYELTEPSAIEFRVFALSGEEVYSRDFPEGSAPTAVGENLITWDGRNNRGGLVLNGIYICSIKVVKTGQTARTKLALVK
jgi:hypothetical protein